MRPHGYSSILAALAGALLLVPAAQAQYGTGAVQQVPRATGAITLDGVANEAAWANAVTIDLTTNWDGAWSGHPDPDIIATAKVLWNDGVLYLYVLNEDYQAFFWGGEGVPWGGEQVLVGVDLTHAGDDQVDESWGGWIDNAPNLGPVAYKMTGADGPGTPGITLNWSNDPVAPGWVNGHVFIDNDNFRWGVELAIYGVEIQEGAMIGFNIGGATASAEQAGEGDDGAYAYYAWQVCDPIPPQEPVMCQYAGGNVMADSRSFGSLHFVNTVANEGGPGTVGTALRPNVPNPFSSATTLPYELARAGQVELVVFDVLGRQVARLDEGVRAAGEHQAVLQAAGLPGGIYSVRLVVDGTVVAARRVIHSR